MVSSAGRMRSGPLRTAVSSWSTAARTACRSSTARAGTYDEGCAYVSDMVPSLQKVGPKGERLGRCRPVLNGAHGISGTPDGDILLAESNPNRITRLRLQPAKVNPLRQQYL